MKTQKASHTTVVISKNSGTFTIETWWDRRTRSYVTQTKDANGWQIGSADYAGFAEWAIKNHDARVAAAYEM